MYYKNMLGKTYGKWTVIDLDPHSKKKKLICKCACGTVKNVDTFSLYHSGTLSCGKCNIYIDENIHMKCIMKNGAFFIFDHKDLDFIKPHTWSISSGHVRTSIDGKDYYLHRMLLGVSDIKIQIDHINRNKLDNRRCNLRFATHQQNQCNKDLMSNNSTGYKGVCFDQRSKKYISYINKNGVRTYLGYYDNALKAAEIYNIFAERLHGEFARLNEIR